MLLQVRFPHDPRPEDFRRALDDDLRRIFLGNLDGVAVGFAAVRLRTLTGGARLADLEALYVLPDARGVGLGEALMEAVLAWATEAGATGIDSVALPGDRVTKNFFERFGLTARALQVYRRLPAAGAGEE